MRLWIHAPRKDGKFPCTLVFDSGKRIKKLYTLREAKEAKRNAEAVAFEPFAAYQRVFEEGGKP